MIFWMLMVALAVTGCAMSVKEVRADGRRRVRTAEIRRSPR